MKKGSIYTFYRTLFGIYMIWMALINLDKIENNSTHVRQSVDNFNNIFSMEGILTYFNLHNHIPLHEVQKYSLNLETIKETSIEIVYLMNASLIAGGFLCIFGYQLSFTFILIGLILDLIFIHNYFYFRDEKMKVNVLKMIAILGGAFHIV